MTMTIFYLKLFETIFIVFSKDKNLKRFFFNNSQNRVIFAKKKSLNNKHFCILNACNKNYDALFVCLFIF